MRREPYDMHFNDGWRTNLERWIVRRLTPSRWPGHTEPRPDVSDKRAHANWLGRRGETYACWWLCRNKGFVILDRNYRNGPHELDIVARDGLVTVFVEVRTLSDDFLQRPSASITPQKRECLHKAAAAWRQARRHRGAWRMDIFGIVWPDPERLPARADHWAKCL